MVKRLGPDLADAFVKHKLVFTRRDAKFALVGIATVIVTFAYWNYEGSLDQPLQPPQLPTTSQ